MLPTVLSWFLPFYSCRLSFLIMLLTFLSCFLPFYSCRLSFLHMFVLSCNAFLFIPKAFCSFLEYLSSFLVQPVVFIVMPFVFVVFRSFLIIYSHLFSLKNFLLYHFTSFAALASFPFIFRLIFSSPLNGIFSSAWSLVVKCQLSGGEGERGRRGTNKTVKFIQANYPPPKKK